MREGEQGFTVHLAPNGRTGVDLVRTHDATVVTVDVGLPDIDGVTYIGERGRGSTYANDINNHSGDIRAQDSLLLEAGHDINVITTTNTQHSSQGSRTNIDRIAGLYVNSGSLLANAGHNITLTGAALVLLGAPVAHSLSPRFQNAALDAAGIALRYEARHVEPAALGGASTSAPAYEVPFSTSDTGRARSGVCGPTRCGSWPAMVPRPRLTLGSRK
mgnify:CR=1 FL=1